MLRAQPDVWQTFMCYHEVLLILVNLVALVTLCFSVELKSGQNPCVREIVVEIGSQLFVCKQIPAEGNIYI